MESTTGFVPGFPIRDNIKWRRKLIEFRVDCVMSGNWDSGKLVVCNMGRTREASGVLFLNTRLGLTRLSKLCRDPAIGVRNGEEP